MKQKRINKKKLELARYVVLLIIMNAYQTGRKQISWIGVAKVSRSVLSKKRVSIIYFLFRQTHRKKKIIRCHPATPS